MEQQVEQSTVASPPISESRRYYSEIQRLLKEKLGENTPIRVYYPGIGGGEEGIDPFSPFILLDADEVFGIDRSELLQDSTQYDEKVRRKLNLCDSFEDYVKYLNGRGVTNVEDIAYETTDVYWRVTFTFNGRRRQVTMLRQPIDAERYIPSQDFDFNVIYSRRTIGLVGRLPDEVLHRAQAIFTTEHYQRDGEDIDKKATIAQNFERVNVEDIYRQLNLTNDDLHYDVYRQIFLLRK